MSLRSRALAELELRKRRRAALPLADFVAEVSDPGAPYEPPHHLAALTQALEATESSPQRVLLSVPPRHGKTETLLSGIARRLLRRPQTRIAYVSYVEAIALDKSRRARAIAQRAGVSLSRASSSASNWETTRGGGVFATGTDGPLTALGFDLIVVDDPHKNRADAESQVLRKKVRDWFTSTARTRLEPGGSIVVCHTRWHEDDLIGSLQGKPGWNTIALPAIDAAGHALWPSRWPCSELEALRADLDDYDWWSLYQQSPRPRGQSVFNDCHTYDALPTEGYRVAIGVDLAYTSATSADYSVAVVLYERGGIYYVVDVVRDRCQAPAFADKLKALYAKHKTARMLAYLYGPELGTASFIRKEKVPLRAISATGDKYQRAQGIAKAWNQGRVLVPRDAPWLSAFLSEVMDFTGVDDDHDDQVDALAAASGAFGRKVVYDASFDADLPQGRI